MEGKKKEVEGCGNKGEKGELLLHTTTCTSMGEGRELRYEKLRPRGGMERRKMAARTRERMDKGEGEDGELLSLLHICMCMGDSKRERARGREGRGWCLIKNSRACKALDPITCGQNF